MDLTKEQTLANPFHQHGTFKERVLKWIEQHDNEIISAGLINTIFADAEDRWTNCRDLLAKLERKNILVRIGYGRYVTYLHYQRKLHERAIDDSISTTETATPRP